MDAIKRGQIQKPAENPTGENKEKIIQYGVRTPKSSFDKRVNGDQGPVGYFGNTRKI